MLRLGADKLEGPGLDEADADGDDHDDVDESVGDVEDEDCDEVVAGLADEGEVEDEGDGEGDEAEEAQEHPGLGVGHVQPMVHWDTTLYVARLFNGLINGGDYNLRLLIAL